MRRTSTLHSRFCLWPPQVIKTEDLGYVEDTSGRYYPRDGGRSSAVRGLAVYQFGDTFAHDAKGNFVGVSCSNVSIVSNPRKPQLSTYCGVFPNGAIPTNPPLILGEEMNDDWRTTTWCFGGIVFAEESKGKVIEGYTFFQKSHINRKKWEEIIQYTGVAEVSFDTSAKQLLMSRSANDDALFKASILSINHMPPNVSRNRSQARVPFDEVQRRKSYQFWDGMAYQNDISKSTPIMTGLQHGSIHRSRLFEPNTGKDWVFVGCNGFADSTVLIGVAPKPEGPWALQKLIPAPPRMPQPDSSFTYCMYAHPWAYDESKGELMVSWSEGGMRGKIVAVKVTFAQNANMGNTETKKSSLVGKIMKKLRDIKS
ncbi:hypothetical protein B7463_g10970, partial [Scytalidium lignicola]